jgi:aryl-alcohol dehydrogenase-like predicted oxidoreductase
MIPRVRFGRTQMEVTRLALGGYPFGGVNRARGWDPFTKKGREQAIETVHAALDAGINLIDTAPGYGEGNSESIIGEALKGRRDEVYVATKVGYHGTAADVRESVEASLRRLQTEYVDLLQFHGGMYTAEQIDHILEQGLLTMVCRLRDEGRIRFIGFTVEEPWTAKPLIASGAFDVMQVRYNLIYQAAALHVLNEAHEADMGISVMRPMTSGILQRLISRIAPEVEKAVDVYELALEFVLSDSRVHVANVGMRWPEEIEKNAAIVARFTPVFDVADLPRMTAHIYRTEDEAAGV